MEAYEKSLKDVSQKLESKSLRVTEVRIFISGLISSNNIPIYLLIQIMYLQRIA